MNTRLARAEGFGVGIQRNVRLLQHGIRNAWFVVMCETQEHIVRADLGNSSALRGATPPPLYQEFEQQRNKKSRGEAGQECPIRPQQAESGQLR